MRYYLPDLMQHTADIDTKLFYDSSRRLPPVQDKIIVLIVFLMVYMEHHAYFRFEETRNIRFGSHTFRLTFNTLNQENVLSCRFLRDFFVPLLSMDLKLNFYIQRDDGYIFVSQYTNAILDVGFNQTTKEAIMLKKDYNRYISIPPGQIDPTTYSGISYKMIDNSFTLWLTPLPSIEYLIEDLNKMYSNPENAQARRAAGKEEKDNRRKELLFSLHESKMRPDLTPAVMQQLDQNVEITPTFEAQKQAFKRIVEILLHTVFDLQHKPQQAIYENIQQINLFFDDKESGAFIINLATYLGFKDRKLKNKD